MGNAGIGTGWLYSSDHEMPVVLRLNDVRNVRLKGGEDIAGVINLRTIVGNEMPNVAAVRRDSPAIFSIELDSLLTLEMRIKRAGDDGPSAVVVGGVCLPLDHLAKRCGQSVYHTWFPLQQPPPKPLHSETETLDQLDRAMRSVARDPRVPMVCISLYPASASDAAGGTAGDHRYELSVPAGDKALRFSGLEQSHMQHVRLLQSLYRQSRQDRKETAGHSGPGVLHGALLNEESLAQERMPPALNRMESLMPERLMPQIRSMESSDTFDLPGPAEVLHPGGFPSGNSGSNIGGAQETISRLQREIETTTAEANLRINQASDAIRTLKERLGARQAEHEHLRQENVRLQHDADALGLENERLAIQLERKARDRAANPRSREERELELKRLKRETEMLKEQKEALMTILEDLYGAKANSGHPGQGPSSNKDDGGDDEGWTNMLPRPSELFEGGVLEDNTTR